MLTADQIATFHAYGFVQIPRALEELEISTMRARLWDALRRNGAEPDDPSTWNPSSSVRLHAVRRDDKHPADNTVFSSAVDALCGSDVWKPPKNWGQALVTFPQSPPWKLAQGPWHLDYPYWFPADAIWGLNVFLFVDQVVPRGGGTLVVRSSHKLVERFAAETGDLRSTKQAVLTTEFRSRYPWFADLGRRAGRSIDDAARINRFMDGETQIEGIGVRVIELTGEPGDIVLCHPWLVHSSSSNVQGRPRLMRAARVWRRHVHDADPR